MVDQQTRGREDARRSVAEAPAFQPVSAKAVEALPPWEREACRYQEVPAVLKRLYNVSVRGETVYRWMKTGLPSKADGTRRVTLAHHTKLGRIFVKIQDLKDFLDAT